MHLSPSSTMLALRAWWPIVVVLAVAGAALGVQSVGSAPFSATTLLRVDVSTNPLQSPQIVATALQVVDSDPVYFKATDETAEAADELRARTTVGLSDNAAVLKVSVVAPTAEQATEETDRFADAALEYIAEMSREEFDRATRLAQEALNGGALPNPMAEELRLEQLGANLAEAQNSAYRQIDLVSRIGGVHEPERLGLPPRLAAPLGAVIGALAGGIAALVLGVQRRRIRRPAEVKAVGPGIRVYGSPTLADGLLRVAARCATLDQPLVAILALPDAEDALNDVRNALRRQLRVERLRWVDVDADDFGRASVADRRATAADRRSSGEMHVPVRHARAQVLAEAEADVIVVTGLASTRAVKEAGARADAVILVGRQRKTRIGELSAVYAEVADVHPVVALLPANTEEFGEARDDPPADTTAAPAAPSAYASAPVPSSPYYMAPVGPSRAEPVGADAPGTRAAPMQRPDPLVAEVPARATVPSGNTNGNGTGAVRRNKSADGADDEREAPAE
jgi:hypothetical protein